MWITAALLGLGVFILFFDLPKQLQGVALQNMWVPHLLIFVVLVAIHGGSAEGTVVAGIATLVFRWFLHRLAKRRGHERVETPTQPKQKLSYLEQIIEDNKDPHFYDTERAFQAFIFSITAIITLIAVLK